MIKALGSSWQTDFQAKGLSPGGTWEVCERYRVFIETISDDIRKLCVDLAELKFPIPKLLTSSPNLTMKNQRELGSRSAVTMKDLRAKKY